MGPWSVYASIVVIAVGLYIYLSAPKRSFLWLLLTIAVATLAQTFAGHVLNTGHSGFIGAMVAIPFAVLSSQIKGAPPASVLTLAAFWTLVPGQLTFMSLGRHAAGGPGRHVDHERRRCGDRLDRTGRPAGLEPACTVTGVPQAAGGPGEGQRVGRPLAGYPSACAQTVRRAEGFFSPSPSSSRRRPPGRPDRLRLLPRRQRRGLPKPVRRHRRRKGRRLSPARRRMAASTR